RDYPGDDATDDELNRAARRVAGGLGIEPPRLVEGPGGVTVAAFDAAPLAAGVPNRLSVEPRPVVRVRFRFAGDPRPLALRPGRTPAARPPSQPPGRPGSSSSGSPGGRRAAPAGGPAGASWKR